MRNITNKVALFVALSMLALAVPVSAQFSGRVSGVVVDPTGGVVPNAQVDLYLAGGAKPLLSTTTTGEGLYDFLAVRPGEFDVTVESPGFNKATIRKIVVDPGRETSVPQIKLEVLSVSLNVEVSATAETVGIGNAEVSTTITMAQVDKLPVIDRDPLELIQTQPGVSFNGNSTTVINGLRTSYSNMTLDGINIQDNYIRDNALDYSPNKVLLGQVREMTLVTSNSNAAAASGATQLDLAIPSGGNQFHGEAFWYNRNNYFSANDWFNNQ
ncbi:MAG TPA: carboxypeptidase regulatory-like domain-containing protein, partial [Terriglobia bacterium]|nr:carboxypeptidase regulatory-like domain-containing protein [Terriglobia bacterium]